jgi:hypothetical protein
MNMKKQKSEVITFKVDEVLSEELKNIPNRSAFIRAAVTSALAATCPLCQGAGFLTPRQKEHWEAFAEYHSVQKCGECNENYLICGRDKVKAASG